MNVNDTHPNEPSDETILASLHRRLAGVEPLVPPPPAWQGGAPAVHPGVRMSVRSKVAFGGLLPLLLIAAVVTVALAKKADGTFEPWPTAADFTPAQQGSETRAFELDNLGTAKYRVMAFAQFLKNGPYVGYPSPYGPYNVSATQMDYSGEVFYIGVADPAWGSVSGTIKIPGTVSGGRAMPRSWMPRTPIVQTAS